MLKSPQKAFNHVSTIKYFLNKLRKQILQLIGNYSVLWHCKEVKSVEIDKSGSGFLVNNRFSRSENAI